MKALKQFFVLALSAYLFGCASPATMDNMVYRGEQKNYSPDIKNNIVIGQVSGGKNTNPAWMSEIGNNEFQSALKESLILQGLYSDNGKYQLEVQMVKVDKPLLGFDLEVTSTIRYILSDKASKITVLDETVTASYTATVSDAFVAVKRLRLANEGSARNNIEGLLQKLSQLNIDPSAISLAK